MVYFSNRLGGSALIGVMIHGMTNDSFALKGTFLNEEYQDSVLMQFITLMPQLVVAGAILYISKGMLAFNAENPGRQVWTWPKR